MINGTYLEGGLSLSLSHTHAHTLFLRLSSTGLQSLSLKELSDFTSSRVGRAKAKKTGKTEEGGGGGGGEEVRKGDKKEWRA